MAASMIKNYDDSPDGKMELIEFAQLIQDLDEGVARFNAPKSSQGSGLSASGAGAVPTAAMDDFEAPADLKDVAAALPAGQALPGAEGTAGRSEDSPSLSNRIKGFFTSGRAEDAPASYDGRLDA